MYLLYINNIHQDEAASLNETQLALSLRDFLFTISWIAIRSDVPDKASTADVFVCIADVDATFKTRFFCDIFIYIHKLFLLFKHSFPISAFRFLYSDPVGFLLMRSSCSNTSIVVINKKCNELNMCRIKHLVTINHRIIILKYFNLISSKLLQVQKR